MTVTEVEPLLLGTGVIGVVAFAGVLIKSRRGERFLTDGDVVPVGLLIRLIAFNHVLQQGSSDRIGFRTVNLHGRNLALAEQDSHGCPAVWGNLRDRQVTDRQADSPPCVTIEISSNRL